MFYKGLKMSASAGKGHRRGTGWLVWLFLGGEGCLQPVGRGEVWKANQHAVISAVASFLGDRAVSTAGGPSPF